MKEGYVMGVRGPLGNWYPWEEMEGKNIVIVGGGFAFTTLRSSIVYMLHPENRKSRFKDITVVYGARSPGMLLYKDELAAWEAGRHQDAHHRGWDERSELEIQRRLCAGHHEAEDPKCGGCHALVCGPPIMIKFTQPVLEKLGFPPERIILTLEMRMKCGIGMCGRCNIGANSSARTARSLPWRS